ncbi:MAG: FlgO family outer membrane protein [Campylobacterales bacterium]|nr:FlgO family outer membrane protein [Campylobacterales bacterium]
MFKLIKQLFLASLLSTLAFSLTSAENISSEKDNIEKDIEREINKVKTAKIRMRVAKDMEENVSTQTTLEHTISSLATQMMQNNKFNTNRPVLITSFVKLHNLKETTEFGRLLSESLINDLSNRNFNIIEFRGQIGVSINKQGEYFLSRNTNKIKSQIENTFIVVGTYSRQYGKIMINARVIDNGSGRIITSARATYKHGKRNDCVIFNDCKPPRTIRIVKE